MNENEVTEFLKRTDFYELESINTTEVLAFANGYYQTKTGKEDKLPIVSLRNDKGHLTVYWSETPTEIMKTSICKGWEYRNEIGEFMTHVVILLKTLE